MAQQLTKSNDKIICGACGGLAEYLNVDPAIIRIAYAALTLFTGGFPGIILYCVMAFVMPRK